MARKAVLILAVIAMVLHGCIRLLGIGSPIVVQPDSRCGYIIKPNQDTTRFFSSVHINAYGMRSAELGSPDRLRVMFLGDSVTYGTTRVDQIRLFVSQIGSKLAIDALNVSASAWSISNEVSYLASRGDFGSRLIVFVLNPGDMIQRRSEISSIGGAVYTERPAIAEKEIFDRLFRRRTVDAGDSAFVEDGAALKENLATLEQASQGRNVAILFIPFRKDPQGSAKARDVLSTWASGHHIPFLDTTPALIDYPVKAVTLDGDHLSPKGHDLVAQLSAPWIEYLLRH